MRHDGTTNHEDKFPQHENTYQVHRAVQLQGAPHLWIREPHDRLDGQRQILAVSYGLGSSTTIDPKPMYIEGGPAAERPRKSSGDVVGLRNDKK